MVPSSETLYLVANSTAMALVMSGLPFFQACQYVCHASSSPCKSIPRRSPSNTLGSATAHGLVAAETAAKATVALGAPPLAEDPTGPPFSPPPLLLLPADWSGSHPSILCRLLAEERCASERFPAVDAGEAGEAAEPPRDGRGEVEAEESAWATRGCSPWEALRRAVSRPLESKDGTVKTMAAAA